MLFPYTWKTHLAQLAEQERMHSYNPRVVSLNKLILQEQKWEIKLSHNNDNCM